MSTLVIKGPVEKGRLIPRAPGKHAAANYADLFLNWPSDYAHPGRDSKGKLKGKKPKPVGEDFERSVPADPFYIRLAIDGAIEIVSPQSEAVKVKNAKAQRAAVAEQKLGPKPPAKPKAPKPPKGDNK